MSAFILGVSLWLTVGEAKALASSYPVNVVVTTTSVSKSKQTLKEKVGAFFQRVRDFFNHLGKLGWGPFSLIVLAILTPPLAVGIASDWDPDKVLIAILLTSLCGLPGIIYAIVVALKD